MANNAWPEDLKANGGMTPKYNQRIDATYI